MTSFALLLLDVKWSALPWLATAVLIIASGVLLVLGILLVLRGRIGFWRRAVSTPGTVIKSTHGIREVGGKSLAGSLAYDTKYYANLTASYEVPGAGTQQISGRVWIPDVGQDYFDGDPVEVFYDPLAPKKAKLATRGTLGLPKLLVVTLVGVAIIGVGYLFIPSRLTEAPVPLAAFPQQLGKLTRKGEPWRTVQLTDADSFAASYSSPDGGLEFYEVVVSNKPAPARTVVTDPTHNTLAATTNLDATFYPQYDRITIIVNAGKMRITTAARSVSDDNDVVNN
jgi:hypothetical protein